MQPLEVLLMSAYPDGEFRWGKALQYPDDPRNKEAAEILDQIAAELPAFENSDLHARIQIASDRWSEENAYYFCQILSAIQLDVGFRSGIKNAKDYLEEVVDQLEAGLLKYGKIEVDLVKKVLIFPDGTRVTMDDLRTVLEPYGYTIEKAASTKESAIRSRANAWGFKVARSRRRDLDHQGQFQLIDASANVVVLGERFDASLEEIGDYLTADIEIDLEPEIPTA